MEMERTLPTRGQLERQLSQTLQSLYRDKFGHLPSKVVCHLFADKVVIIAENTVTSVEKLLLKNSQVDLAGDVRSVVNEIFALELKQKIAEILEVEVIDLIGDSCSNSEYLGMIAILSDVPKVRLARKTKNRKTQSINKNTNEATNNPIASSNEQ